MGHFATVTTPIRADLVEGLDAGWRHLTETGSWLTGVQRAEIVTAARAAWDCAFCAERKTALSPQSVTGVHDRSSGLPASWVDVIHRVVTDSGRLTEQWCQDALATGLLEDEFVEVLNVAIATTAIDSFAFGIGTQPPPLEQVHSEPAARARTPYGVPGVGWIATISPENAGDFVDFYANDSHFYIRRALTLVPEECREFWKIANVLYLEDPRVHELDGVERGISRAQMEFLAARASMLLDCYY
jgi:hypothetical protein